MTPAARYEAVESALETHIAACPSCAAGTTCEGTTCEAGFDLLREEAAAWSAFETADPPAAAGYDLRWGTGDA